MMTGRGKEEELGVGWGWGVWKADEGELAMTANGGLTHGAPVDGLGLVFVLGSVPHERQPFNSCQSAAGQPDRRTDRGGEGQATEQRKGGGGEETKGEEKKREEGTEQRDVVNVVTERVRGEMHWAPEHIRQQCIRHNFKHS